MAFQNDPDGTYLALAAELRSQEHPFDSREGPFAPSFEPIEEEGTERTDPVEGSSTPDTRSERTLPAAPLRTRDPQTSIRALSGPPRDVPATPEVEMANKYKKQKNVIQAWIDDPQHLATEDCRHVLELYVQLTDSEFSYVSKLQSIYDETRCFFLQWVLGKEIKELVNSARISAVQMGDTFTWLHAREETLRTLTDVTLTNQPYSRTVLPQYQYSIMSYSNCLVVMS